MITWVILNVCVYMRVSVKDGGKWESVHEVNSVAGWCFFVTREREEIIIYTTKYYEHVRVVKKAALCPEAQRTFVDIYV